MKNLLLLSPLALLISCGPSAEEVAAKQKREQDSIRQIAIADSIHLVQEARAKQYADSVTVALEAAVQDAANATK